MKRLALGLAQVCFLAAAPPVTLEWLMSPEARSMMVMPRTFWLKDGTLLLEDLRKPEKDWCLERMDPATGKRVPALDQAKALANLKAALGAKEEPKRVPWPEAVDDAGRHALVQAGEGYFVMDFATATFQAVPGADSASLSPDGRRVAFIKGHDLYVLDLETRAERRLTKDGTDTVLNGTFSWVYWEEIFDHRDEAYWWSPDSRTLAFLRSDESAVPLHSFTDFKPFQAKVVQQRYPQPGQPNPSVRLGFADAGTGALSWMDAAPGSFEYVVNVTWLPQGGRAAVQTLNRAQDTLDLSLVEAATGTAARILRERADTWVHFYEPTFLKDGKHFLWASDRTGFNHLYRYTLDGKLVNPVTRGDWSVTPWGQYAGGHSGLLSVDEKGGWAYVTAQAETSVEAQVYRARLDGSAFERLSKEKGRHGASFSPDGRFYLDRWSAATVPPSLAVHRADGTPLQVLAPAPTGLDFQTPTLFTIPAADGLPLNVSVNRPRNADPSKRCPVIFHVYGGPGAPMVQDTWGDPKDQLLLNEGYALVSVDNRSSAAVGMKYEAAIKGQLYGEVEVQDLLSAVKWVKAQSWADPERVGVWGWSGGGTYTLAALTRTKEFKAGISVAPVSDWRYYDSVYTEMSMKLPADNPKGYEATSQVATAKDLHGRLLLVHGTYDDNVHPQNAQAFADALIASGKVFESMSYPMRKHGISDKPATLHLYRTMLDFWKRNL
jgi:dipeptidyl-peptidase-4